MTVRELIELNQMITDVVITVRKNGSLLDQLSIGCSEGVKPPFPLKVPKEECFIHNIGRTEKTHREATYLPKSINSWDDGRDYWEVKTKRIPAKWLDLEVYNWESHPASTVKTTSPRRGGVSKNINFHGECLWITALPSGENLSIPKKRSKEVSEYEGQMSFDDWDIDVVKI